MPTVKPFRAIRPINSRVNEVIARPPDLMYSVEAEEHKSENQYTFLHLMEPMIGNPYQRGSVQDIIFKKISENLHDFMEDGVVVQDEKPAIYLYRINTQEGSHTGLWMCSSIDDYLDNTIRKHELTRSEREQGLIDYFEHTGIDGNPVIVAYPADQQINAIIAQTQERGADQTFETEGNLHELWCINQEATVNTLCQLFAEMPAAYIADGHHRAAAASILGIQRRKLNLKHKGEEAYNFFSSIYFSNDQVKIYEFHRLISELNGLSDESFLKALEEKFSITSANAVVKPAKTHEFGMYLSGKWYTVAVKPEKISFDSPVAQLDVTVLHDHILNPILGIKDAKTDKRIDFAGGLKPLNKLLTRVDSGEMRVLFTVFPTSMDELMAVADNGDTMPPKSTWFEPKLHCGLAIHYLG